MVTLKLSLPLPDGRDAATQAQSGLLDPLGRQNSGCECLYF